MSIAPAHVPGSRSARPFLKWAGGKGQLLAQFRPLLPPSRDRYFEPFVGGASLFFALGPPVATLSDVNAELIDCYRAVRDDVEQVIAALNEHRYSADHYYEVRATDPASLPLAQRAARTIFLNKTGYNGLYRVNRAGRFNVPMGRYRNPSFCDPENLRACSLALRGVGLEVRDFGAVLQAAQPGDFVYFDPPYVPASPTADFTSYVPGGFGPQEQERLGSVFETLAEREVFVMLSNSDMPAVRRLYEGFRIDRVSAARSINSRGVSRGKVAEVVVRNFDGVGGAPRARRKGR